MNYNNLNNDDHDDHNDHDICPICLDRLKTCITLSCEHKFHYVCIHRWYNGTLENNKNCPICRYPIKVFSKHQNISNTITKKYNIFYRLFGNRVFNEIDFIITLFGFFALRTICLYLNIIDINNINLIINDNIQNFIHIVNTIFWYTHYVCSIILLIFEHKKYTNHRNHHYQDHDQFYTYLIHN